MRVEQGRAGGKGGPGSSAGMAGAVPWLAADALATLVVASLLIRIAPFRLTMRLAGLPAASRRAGPTDHLVRQVRWLVRAWARRVPWRAKCYEQGLAAQWILRRRGVPSRLHYGVTNEDGGMSAHVWLTLNDAVILGENDSARHHCLLVRP